LWFRLLVEGVGYNAIVSLAGELGFLNKYRANWVEVPLVETFKPTLAWCVSIIR
jgi:hypothetical protein